MGVVGVVGGGGGGVSYSRFKHKEPAIILSSAATTHRSAKPAGTPRLKP